MLSCLTHSNTFCPFFYCSNKQGQTRLSSYYEWIRMDERVALESEIIRKCLSRSELQCSFLEYRGYKVRIIHTIRVGIPVIDDTRWVYKALLLKSSHPLNQVPKPTRRLVGTTRLSSLERTLTHSLMRYFPPVTGNLPSLRLPLFHCWNQARSCGW